MCQKKNWRKIKEPVRGSDQGGKRRKVGYSSLAANTRKGPPPQQGKNKALCPTPPLLSPHAKWQSNVARVNDEATTRREEEGNFRVKRKEGGGAVTELTLRRALPVPPLGTEVTAEDDEDLCEAICWRGGGGTAWLFPCKKI